MMKVPYASVIGSLMYAVVCTTPDISQAVSMVSRYIHDLGRGHWQTVKWNMWYLKSTEEVGLLYKKKVSVDRLCVGYVNLNYAGDLDKRRSTTGYIFTLAGGPVG